MLANEGQRLREKSARAALGEDVSDDEEEDDIEEELGYISPLDTVNPYVSFKQALTSECYLFICPHISRLLASHSIPNEERPCVPSLHYRSQSRAADMADGGHAHCCDERGGRSSMMSIGLDPYRLQQEIGFL